ncbi:MAG: isopenicillin N synthase family dioxygenase [Reyranella sp.]
MLPQSRPPRPSEIPVIDLKGWRFDSSADRQAVADSLAKACREVGFFYIVNHGVAAASVDDMFGAARSFFDLPPKDKGEVALARQKNFRGYIPPFHKGRDPNLKENMQEAFQIHLELPPDDPDVLAGKPMHGPNPWPSAMPDLKPRMLDYQRQLWELGQQMLHLFALGLGLPEDTFDEYFHKPMLMLRLLHYPPQAPDESGDHIGTRPHTDTGCFTILAQDQIGGLEILTKSGEWVFVPPLPGSYVVNIGEMMKAWTDGIFASTPHRVVNRYGAERYSVPFFVNPDYDAIFRPLMRNPDPVEAPKLHSTIDTDKDIKCGDWMVQLYSRIYPAPPPDVAAE